MSNSKLRSKKSHSNNQKTRLNNKGKGSFKILRKPYARSFSFRSAVRCLLCQTKTATWDAVMMQFKMLTKKLPAIS